MYQTDRDFGIMHYLYLPCGDDELIELVHDGKVSDPFGLSLLHPRVLRGLKRDDIAT